MATTAFPQTPIGLPNQCKYELAPSLSDSARCYSVHVAPDGITSVTGPTNTTSAFVANSTGAFGSFNSQVVSFTIPSGMSSSVFLDPSSTTLSFTLTHKISTASAGATGGILKLIGGAYSFFDSLVLYHNSVPLETINQYGLLQNYLVNNSVNMSERFGGLSVSCGCDNNGTSGIDLAHSTIGTYKYNFAIPLCSIIGYNTDKWLPIGSINNLQLQMTTANQLPYSSYCTAITTQPVIDPIVLSDFQLNLKYVDVGDMASALLKQTLQDGKWFIKSTTYTQSAVSIPTGSSGNQQLLLQIRNSSVKSILQQFGVSQSAVTPNGLYDAVNIATTSRQCQVGGQFFPTKPCNDLNRNAEAYIMTIGAMGGTIPKALGTSVARDSYNACLQTPPAGSDSALVVCASGLRGTPNNDDTVSAGKVISNFPSMAYYGYDLEKANGSILFQGMNTRASPPFLNLYLAQAVPASTTIMANAWGMSDVVVVCDVLSNSVQAFI